MHFHHLSHVVVVGGGGGGDIGGVGGVGVDQLSRVRLSCSDSDLSVRSVSTWSKQGGRQPLVPWYLQLLSLATAMSRYQPQLVFSLKYKYQHQPLLSLCWADSGEIF